MPLGTATVTFDFSDQLDADFDARRTKVWVTTNVPSETIVDVDGNKIRLGSGNVTVNADGTGTFTTWVPGTGSNPASWQTYLHVDYPDRNAPRGRGQRTFGPFTITASADLADLIAEQEVPPDYLTKVTEQLDTYVDSAAASASAATAIVIADVQGAMAAAVDAPGPVKDALAATYGPVGQGVARFIERARAGESLKITAVGDSILEGLTTTTPATDAAMVLLKNDLATRFGVTVTMTNHAESGFTAARAGIGGNMDAALADNPDLIVVSAFDKNDLGQDIYGQYAPGYRADLSNAAIERFIRKARTQTPKADIIILATNPYAAGNASNPYQLAKIQSVKRLAAHLGVEVADAYQAFATRAGGYAGLMADDTHPNTAGHRLIADTLLAHFPNRAFPSVNAPAAISAKGYTAVENVDTSTGSTGYMNGSSPGNRFGGKHVWTINGAGWTLDGSSRDVSSTAGDYVEHTFFGTESLIQLDTAAAFGLHLKITIDGVDVVTNQDMTLGKQGIYYITGAQGLTAAQHVVRYTIVSGTFAVSAVAALAAPATATFAPAVVTQLVASTVATTTLTAAYQDLASGIAIPLPAGWAGMDVQLGGWVAFRTSGATTAARRIDYRLRNSGADVHGVLTAEVPVKGATTSLSTQPLAGLIRGLTAAGSVSLQAKIDDATTGTIQATQWHVTAVLVRTA